MIQLLTVSFFAALAMAAPPIALVLNDTAVQEAPSAWDYLQPAFVLNDTTTLKEVHRRPPPIAWNDTTAAFETAPSAGQRDNIDERGPYVGGDMVVTSEQMADMRAGIVGSNYRWPGGQVPYVLDGFTSAELTTIGQAMQQIQSKTCIRFVPRSSQRDYIFIDRGYSGSGCWSMVGRQGGAQTVNLQYDGCIYPGIVAHELIHAIGYFHEQSRTDRDSYVRIHYENVQQGTESNFDKYPATQVSPYGVSYDYESIMHYSAYAFSKNGLPTIDPLGVPRNVLGQRNNLSSMDGQKINNMYSGICQ